MLVVESPDEPARPTVLPPLGFVFPPGETFKHFDLKWRAHDSLTWVTSVEPRTAARLRDVTARVFTGIQGEELLAVRTSASTRQGWCGSSRSTPTAGSSSPRSG